MSNPASLPNRSTFRRDVYCALGIVLIGLLVRWPRMSQSLWYDEMTTVTQYLIRPWQPTVAAGAGEYVPNNHVLNTILERLADEWLSAGPQMAPPDELVLRLPALSASLLLPIALAWPLRKTEPLLAGAAAVLAAVNPWLAAVGTEARGYPLMLLLGVAATNLLRAPAGEPNRKIGRWTIRYAVSLAAAIYTVPLAILLVPAHAAAVGATRCVPWRRWIIAAIWGLLLAAVLYLPMTAGLISYYRHPYQATMSLRALVDWLPRYAWTGDRLPRDGSVGAVFWAVPVLTTVIGSVLAWQRPAARAVLVSLLSVTGLGLLLAVIDPAAREVRFVVWTAPLFCLTAAAALTTVPGWPARTAGAAGFAGLLLFCLQLDRTMLPNQPIREGIAMAYKTVPSDRKIIVLYLGARESIALYGDPAQTGRLVPAPDEPAMVQATEQAVRETGYMPWVLIYFEQQAAARDSQPGDAQGLYSNLVKNYRRVQTLPARLGRVTLYAPIVQGRVESRNYRASRL